MEISEKKRNKLFTAIDEPVTKLRVKIASAYKNKAPLISEEIDIEMFHLVLEIHKEVQLVLNISER